MNEILEKFFEEQEKNKEEIIKKRKEEHLKKLGLFDESKAVKKYFDVYWGEEEAERKGYLRDDNRGYFKYVSDTPIEVTDEEFEKILEYCPMDNENEDKDKKLLLEMVDAIRRMMKFFTILTIILLSLSLISVIVTFLLEL